MLRTTVGMRVLRTTVGMRGSCAPRSGCVSCTTDQVVRKPQRACRFAVAVVGEG